MEARATDIFREQQTSNPAPVRSNRVLKRFSSALVARAERLCLEKKLRFTPMRRRVLAELSASAEPLTAYDLADRVRYERRVAPVTVYRALQFLLEAKLIHRIEIRNAYLACKHGPHGDVPPSFLVCTRCGNVTEIHSHQLERDLRDAVTAAGFAPKRRILEIEGECSKCLRHSP